VQDLRLRTRNYSLNVIKLVEDLPATRTADVIGKQVLRSGTSVGAHYREACRAKSNADFISKIEGGLQELEETACWLELLDGTKLGNDEKVAWLTKETDEFLAMFVSMVKSAKTKR